MIRQPFFAGILAGMTVGIGGIVFMSCDNKYVGAVLFSVALLCVCYLSMYLYTGKIGFLAEKFSWGAVRDLAVGLVGNYIGATLTGIIIRYARADYGISEKAKNACLAKLEYNFLQAFILGAFCGIMMYLAVKIYREKNSVWGIFFCIPVFILCGFEHSVADMFYFALGDVMSFGSGYIKFILTVVLGNTIGAMIIPWFNKLATVKEAK